MSDPSPRPAGRLLLVDDNAALVENLVEILTDAGHHVSVAATLAEAEARARAGVDVALVDLQLPDGQGTSLAERVRAFNPDAELILLTGYATVESAAAAVRAGAWAYLVKPCATSELLVTVEQALRQIGLKREKAELGRRAQTAEKLAAVGTLTAGLSHEIRNPLNAAALQLSVLERRVRKLPAESQGPLLGPLTLVRDEIRRLDHVLEDFLQFARPTALVARPVALRELLERVAAFMTSDAERRGVKIAVRCEGAPVVAGDADRLRQVFMNLTLNALDASPPGGEVGLSCLPAGVDVLARIDDEGAGVPREYEGRVFEPFFTTKAAGTGLGLPIVHAIVDQHGGAIGFERRTPRGMRFWVRLPAARGAGAGG